MKNIIHKNERNGITLVALVVTIVVLLILAGITLTYVFGDNSVFKQASQAKIQTELGKAREKIEMVLSEAKIPKHTNSKYNENEYLDEFILSRISNTEVLDEVIITDGYAFELDRSEPKIGEYLGKKEELVFPTVTVSEVVWAEDTKSATFTITANEETKGINRIEIWLSGVKLETIPCNNEKTVTKPYIVTRNGVYKIKAYADLSASATANVIGIVPAVEFSPNGNTEWKKQHSTKIIVRETEERITSLKYKWTTDGVTAPAEGEFREDCPSDNNITGKDMTGTYYLWILLETETGKKNVCGSNGFNFDNTAPTAKLLTDWIEEGTENRLKITISNVRDIHSGMNENAKIYLTPENGNREEKSIILSNGTGDVIIEGLDREIPTKVEMFLQDNAGNQLNYQKYSGRIYIIKNGKILKEVSGIKESSSAKWNITETSGDVAHVSALRNYTAPNSTGWLHFGWLGGTGSVSCSWKNCTLSFGDTSDRDWYL